MHTRARLTLVGDAYAASSCLCPICEPVSGFTESLIWLIMRRDVLPNFRQVLGDNTALARNEIDSFRPAQNGQTAVTSVSVSAPNE